jgi:CRP-like cAMP-binding protein
MTLPDPALIEALQHSPLARELNPGQVALLATVVRLDALPAHALLAREGAPDNRLFSVVDGALSVVKNRGTPEEVVLSTLGGGDFAHELGFLDGTPRYASLVAGAPTRVLVLEREGLEGLLDAHPRLVYAVMCAIVRTVHRMQSRLSMQASELTNYIVKQHGRY